jgi:hypothetical protein
MIVGSTAGVISGLSPGAEKAGEDLYTNYVPDGTTDIIIIMQYLCTTKITICMTLNTASTHVVSPLYTLVPFRNTT